ncbi:antA/AntB antirepressor family protein [Enterococcus gallinarum]|uniref:antA/AntB antirepressor family protein n=1 Tax=Enterococcus gallinarum TaxID=1353 RepID=UPI001AD72042|nr:antA/AntB antirepressor family protein [Enterococcus gallinarum]MBO6417346.1 hypothetical protein [Enterococcus gallinarum]MBO6423409.1 hypothetical protein [Enterococcus gallinarum]
MKELVKVTTDVNGEVLVSGRELHEFLEIETPYRKWFPRMSEYGFEEGVDYTPDIFVHPLNNQETVDHVLKLDMAKEISMIQRTPKGKQARQYFIEVEKMYRQGIKTQVTLESSIKYIIDQITASVREEVLAEIRNDMATAVEMEATLQCEKELQQYKVLTSAKLAEFLGFSGYGRKGAAQLNKALAEAGVLSKQQESNGRKSWKAAEQWVELGLAVESVYVGRGNWVRWTQKGVQRIKEMAELGLITIV